jgi:TolB-like protein/Tfp pilus assembly protein PilF
MPADGQTTKVIRFGAFELDVRAGELRKKGLKVRLQDQPLEILVMLLERLGEVVTREELRSKLWPTDTFVDFDHGLNKAVNRLRVALGDSAENPRFIETLPRRGYRFIEPSSDTNHAGAIEAQVESLKVRLAILPLENLSGDPSQEYFSDGMTEELITQLGGWNPQQLGVIARTSVNKYKKTDRTVGDIGRELKVDYIVEGSIRRAADRVRISAQLIQVTDQMHLWAESYERDLGDILALQDEVAGAITHQIRIKLAPKEHARLTRPRRVHPQAYELCLQGRHHFTKLSGEGLHRASKCFENAIAIDPSYAPPFAGLADCYSKFGQFGYIPPREAYPRAKEAALRALALDDAQADAHASLAMIKLLYDWDWHGAEQEFIQSIGLNPNYAIAHTWYAFYLLAMGKMPEASKEVQRGLELEPLGHITSGLAGWYFYCTRQFDQAISQFQKTIELHPESSLAHFLLGCAYIAKSMFEEAIATLQKAAFVMGNEYATPYIGVALAMSGQPEKARQLLAELRDKSESECIPPTNIAALCATLGEIEQMFDWLEKGYEMRDSNMVFLKTMPDYDPIRPHPRFQSLLSRLSFPDGPSHV